MKKKNLVPLVLLLALSVACVKNVNAPIPGSANAFDSSSYLSLVTTDSVIQSAKADLAASKLPPSVAGNVKTALNGLIQAYNIANVSYQAYHTAALSGQATADQQFAVQTGLANVQTAMAGLTQAKAGN